MIRTEEITRERAAAVIRPSGRTFELPSGPTRDDRGALVATMARLLLEIRTWPATTEIGDRSFLVLDTEIAGAPVYVQFLSSPDAATLIHEVDSGFYTEDFRPTDAQRAAMVSHGFSDGLASNFKKELIFDAPDAAVAIAEQTIALIGNVLGWTPDAPLCATVRHERKGSTAHVLTSVSREDLVELLRRSGLEAKLVPVAGSLSTDGGVETAIDGCPCAIELRDRIGEHDGYRTLVARARVGTGKDASASNPFNALTLLGRSWVDGEDAYLESTLRIGGSTIDVVRDWLTGWRSALATARYWYQRKGPGALRAYHFDAAFHDLHRIARCYVKAHATDIAIAAFIEDAKLRKREATDAIEIVEFFRLYAEARASDALPTSESFSSGADGAALSRWLERVPGVSVTGDLTVRLAVPGAELWLAPADVMHVAIGAAGLTLSLAEHNEVRISADDLYFAPAEARVVVEGSTFLVPDMPKIVSWFETKMQLRALEREMAWAGPLACGGAIAWLRGALAAAAKIGILCDDESARFDGILTAASRAWRARSIAPPSR